MDETQLLQLAKNGDEAAFLSLIDLATNKAKPTIFSTYTNINNEDFKDCLQNARLKAWQKIKAFRGESSFSTWFYIILKNEVLNCINKNASIRRYEIPAIELMPQDDKDHEPVLVAEPKNLLETAQTIIEKRDEIAEYRKMFDAIYERLSPTHGQVMKMVFEDGMSYKEVSNELNVSLGTVMSRLYYARKNAQKLIKHYAESNNIQLSSLGR